MHHDSILCGSKYIKGVMEDKFNAVRFAAIILAAFVTLIIPINIVCFDWVKKISRCCVVIAALLVIDVSLFLFIYL